MEAAAKSAPPKPPKAEPKPKGKVESLTDALTFKAGEPGDDKEEVTKPSLALTCVCLVVVNLYSWPLKLHLGVLWLADVKGFAPCM